MNSPLHRLYQTKLTLLAVILTLAGVALLVGSYLAGELARWAWLTSVPAVEFGAALFTTGLIVVAFEYLDREDAEARAMQRFRKVLHEQAPAIRDAVVKGFACTSDLEDYREQLHDPSNTHTWYFEPIAGMDAASKEVFELAEFAVDGRALPARRTTRTGTQVYSVSLPAETVAVEKEATISFTYRVLVQRHSHLLHLDIGRPTKGLKIHFAYGDCGIRHVSLLDYIASPHRPRVTRLPASDPSPHIEVAHDGWVFPKAGVAFVWVMDGEEMAGR